MNIPESVVDIMELINNQNEEVYLIGGAVRDILTNKTPKDYDLCTSLDLYKLKELIPSFHLMKQNERRNTGITKINEDTIEISMMKGTCLLEDIRKRDFTINGIAMNRQGIIIDPYNYQQDIKEKKIALIDKNGNSIIENPLIILRAIRLAAQLNFKIDKNTKEQIKKNKVLTTRIIGQRMYIELAKFLLTTNFADYFEEYFDVFTMCIPELLNIDKVKLSRLFNTLKITPNNLVLKLAVLFSLNVTQDFIQFSNRMILDKKTTRLVKLLLSYRDKNISTTQKDINKIIAEFNIHNVDLLFLYKKIIENDDKESIYQLEEMHKKYQGTIQDITQTRLSNLEFNLEKIQSMGFDNIEANLILTDIKGRIVSNSLQNKQSSIEAYVLKNYKKS